jgi:hypothetical protein
MRFKSLGGCICGPLFLFTAQPCSAAECSGSTLEAQAGVEHSEWHEFASSGKRLVREQGTLPFAALEAKLACGRGGLTARGLVAQGDWDYSGVSSTGSALNTTSRRSNSELMLTYSYAATPRLEPFFSAGISSGKRDIRSAGPVLGYPEEYRLYPLHAGLQWRPAVFEDRLLLAARVGTALRPQVNVQLPGRDPLTLNLGRTRSAGFSAEWSVGKQVVGQWVLATSWQQTRINASSPGVVTRDGVPTGIASQPRIQLTRVHLSLMWRKLLE